VKLKLYLEQKSCVNASAVFGLLLGTFLYYIRRAI
jgi:hypothetical protein